MKTRMTSVSFDLFPCDTFMHLMELKDISDKALLLKSDLRLGLNRSLLLNRLFSNDLN